MAGTESTNPDPPPDLRGPALTRGLVSLFLVFHLCAVAGSLAKETRPGEIIRTITAPYEQLLGVYQSWNMFAPNAPKRERWMNVLGKTHAGTTQALPPLMGPRPDTPVEWRYRRAGKLERTLLIKRRKRGRMDYAKWHCRESGMARVRLYEVRVQTPSPKDRGRRDGARTVTELRDQRCDG